MHLLTLLVFSLLTLPLRAGPAENDEYWSDWPRQPFLGNSLQLWYKGLSSKKPEVRRQTLQSMLPTQKDIETLFPHHAQQLWLQLDKLHQGMLGRTDVIARDLTRAGTLWAIAAHDIRRHSKKAASTYKKALELLPREVAIYEAVVESQTREAWTGPYLYVNGRWVYFPNLLAVVQAIGRLE